MLNREGAKTRRRKCKTMAQLENLCFFFLPSRPSRLRGSRNYRGNPRRNNIKTFAIGQHAAHITHSAALFR